MHLSHSELGWEERGCCTLTHAEAHTAANSAAGACWLMTAEKTSSGLNSLISEARLFLFQVALVPL